MISIFESKNKLISLNELKEFENNSKIKLPKDYFDFLVENNGGILLNNEYKIYIPPEKDKKRGQNLLFRVFNFYSLEYIKESFNDGLLIEDNKISIGDLDGGYIYISILKEDYGSIYFAHQYYIGMDYLIDEKYLKASNNFSDFLNKIKFIQD